VWRSKWLARFPLIRVPNLNGVWHGVVTPASADERNEEREIEVTIQQSWTRIYLSLATGLSRSTSTTAMPLTEGPDAPAMSYEFFNEP
jgi:SMODS-associating 2TM, beta-strand rich effector domain